jgi:hypothetical protein
MPPNPTNSSGVWLPGEDAIILPITSEPYDWIPGETGEDRFPQLIPVPPPVRNKAPAGLETKLATGPIEGAILIPIGEIPPHKPGADPALDYFIKNEPEPERKHLGSSVLLLLLAVIALFIFAWIALK